MSKATGEIQDTSDCPNSTWPLSVGSSVVVHLTRSNCKNLRDIGDFCILVDVSHAPAGQPGLVVADLTFDGVLEHAVGEAEFGSLLTMEWVRRIREAPDQEVVFVLRQCMVTSEYTVRHLKWEEIPQLDPRNLKGLAPQRDGQALDAEEPGVDTNNYGLCKEAGQRQLQQRRHRLLSEGFVNGGFCDGDPFSDAGPEGAVCCCCPADPTACSRLCHPLTPAHDDSTAARPATSSTCPHHGHLLHASPHRDPTSDAPHCASSSSSTLASSLYPHYGTWHGSRHSWKKCLDVNSGITSGHGLSPPSQGKVEGRDLTGDQSQDNGTAAVLSPVQLFQSMLV
ncbi:hypothetical protein Btru_011582 [Bulinus truncatus]|nr:hypothetical protein Btru_011582 [Bulinus truncatus]